MQEAGTAERHVAVERERETCAQRLQEMSMHFEEQLRVQRTRSASAAAAEQEERDHVRAARVASPVPTSTPPSPHLHHLLHARARRPPSPLTLPVDAR